MVSFYPLGNLFDICLKVFDKSYISEIIAWPYLYTLKPVYNSYIVWYCARQPRQLSDLLTREWIPCTLSTIATEFTRTDTMPEDSDQNSLRKVRFPNWLYRNQTRNLSSAHSENRWAIEVVILDTSWITKNTFFNSSWKASLLSINLRFLASNFSSICCNSSSSFFWCIVRDWTCFFKI